METQIKATIKKLRIQYGLYLVIAVLIMVLYQTGVILEGAYAYDDTMRYALETTGIIATMALVPVSLKLFSIKLVKRIQSAPLEEALKRYMRWSTVRLMLLALATYLNIMIFYMVLSNVGGLCALIGVTASLFCLPGEKRMREELNLITNNEDKE
ncbi:hypothetical protein [Bacteroides sedimenti]|uniref:Transmembrane protein n=1 Tax=Bacteroides sedimenti TaxID=2136147 RepID=A0ABM8I9V4_9BACE